MFLPARARAKICRPVTLYSLNGDQTVKPLVYRRIKDSLSFGPFRVAGPGSLECCPVQTALRRGGRCRPAGESLHRAAHRRSLGSAEEARDLALGDR
jgi:hypothetical protein